MFAYHAQVVRDWLDENMPVRVSTDVPKTRPAQLITVNSTPVPGGYSGIKARVLARRRLIIYSWSADELDAYNLIEQAREWILKLPGKGRGVHAVDIAGEPARRDDIESGARRFVMTVDVVMRSNP
ncbi:hypothetical protein [Mycobacteroides abscessus]|uniref:hypothetical protein n=1 Tax=Mycobacteroides abscessus TaxID=36809 RepID=UPI000C264D95|nr:hypothetical protein [Mycobacteroides abscessus]RIR38446.1 hypothetical protein D2E38_07180 [Mycobacteroides abscessus]RIR38600.1 hypothetical protein D2E36_17270 [Mycobacteroides abscessus]RIS43043.1 hypothetical protein D2E71_15735 [Mycobacteroides abscessus]RIT01355.1 hypothetical protein D2E72_24795 [Mycobacteroides abscessus]RIT20928.1 hypothetical protein D2E81_15640 [Mycobacteroides abscessus]